MRPSSFLLWLAAALSVAGILATAYSAAAMAWTLAAILLVVTALIDSLLLLSAPRLALERRVEKRIALGQPQDVTLTIRNNGWYQTRISLWDGLAPSMDSEHLPWDGFVRARGFTQVTYKLRATERGPQTLGQAHVLQSSPLGLWRRRRRLGQADEVKVFPNYEPVIRFSLLAMQNRVDQMGILSLNRPGVSREFHQLRDYQEGDVMSQIDWKATSRRLSLISREYRQQRDQTIVFAVDCGRRMRAMDGPLTQFDHCLNAILLLSFIAMRQGDSVGVIGFGGASRWLPPLKGSHMMPVLLNHLYDYQTTPEPSDFSEAVERLMTRQKRRALVIFLTNLRSEDSTHLLAPLRILQRQHVVMLASLREMEVTRQLKKSVSTLDDAVTHAATHLYLEDRLRLFSDLHNHGIFTLDESAESLPVALANLYLQIKKQGKL